MSDQTTQLSAPKIQLPTYATGYGTPTGAAQLINFPGASATLAQTSGALADLLTVLKAAGILGA